MFLKRLEINGFKSFANKTVFEFPTGIVGIVGPNGSGKSNVIDAIRWLLGEREAKNLRGGKIEDLIFAGTAKKQKMSMAQVSLVFDNTSGQIPMDFKEVVVSRSINRSGVSQYFINNSEVRLKDIIDFFSKIKLGTKGLTIIGQGSGDIFVKASPVERMMMVQEILGLKEYHLKKNESERKLKNTKINLEKVEAMTSEVAPRLRMLKRQTSRWEKRFEIEQELNELEKNYFAFRIKTFSSAKKKIKEPLPQIELKIKDLQINVDKAKKELDKIEQGSTSTINIELIQKQKRDLFNQKSVLDREFFKIEAQMESAAKQSESVASSLGEIKDRVNSIKEEISSILVISSLDDIRLKIKKIVESFDFIFERKKENKIDLSGLEKEKDKISSALKKIELDIAAIEEEERKISKGMESFNSQFKSAFSHLEELRKELQYLEREEERIKFEEEKIDYKIEELKSQINSAGKHFGSFEEIAKSPSFDASFSESQISDMEKKMLRLRGEISSIGEIDQTLIKEAGEVEAHYNFLTKESKDLSEAITNLDVLIKELNEKITNEFNESFHQVNDEFHKFFRIMFGGGQAKMKVIKKEIPEIMPTEGEQIAEEKIEEEDEEKEIPLGIDIDLSIPQKKITSLEMLSGGEKSLVSLAVLFALISVSPPPFLVLDEVDSALDEKNSKRFSDLVKTSAPNSQFIMVTHNRVTMEAASILYGVTMDENGASKILSLKLEDKVIG